MINYSLDNPGSHEFNNLLSLKTLKQSGDTDKLNLLLNKIKAGTNSAIDRWVIATYTNDTQTSSDLQKKLSDNKYFTIIQKTDQLQ